MDDSTIKFVNELVAQGKSHEEIRQTLLARGVSAEDTDDLLETLHPITAEVGLVPPEAQPTPPTQPPANNPIIGASGRDLAFVAETKQKRKSGLRKLIGVLIVIALAAAVGYGLYTVYVYWMGKPSSKMVTVSTDCYTIDVPSNYKVTLPSNGARCSVSATLHDGKNRVVSSIVMGGTPISARYTLTDATKALQSSFPSDQVSRLTVDGGPAVSVSGTAGGSDQQIPRTFVLAAQLVSVKDYTPETFTSPTNSFICIIGVPPSDQKLANSIIDSIHWK